MASVTATINVQINAANAAAQLTALQGKVAAMNKGMLAATAGGVMAQEKAIRRMGNVLTGSGSFTTGIRNVHTELGRLHSEFDRGTTSLQNYRRNSQMFSKDHSQINRMAADRVRMMQSQYVALGKEMNGVQKAMQIKPTGMMREFGAETMYANQRATLFRRNLQMGSTALVNWGKNTQWAGRQMMVGMGIPIAIAAAGAVKAYNDIEQASISFKRVYGDTTTDAAEKTRMLGQVHDTVGKEMMKYGVAMSDTLDVSAKAAATGAQGADLIAATRETMRLATLGNMDYSKALEATIAMQTAFNINSKDMAQTTDFLNAVENQTILTMEDMALAVPRVAPVIKGLGGNVEDLAIMMTALRQGGVSAEQGANALKSGLGSLLNPTGTAIDQFDQMGINLKKIVDTNKGDLIGTLQGLGKALGGLTKYDRQRALESLFGKYQYARMGALLKNINSKAVKETMKMAKAGAGELAKMSAQELSQISDSPMIKLRASIEELKAAAAPLGALFSDIGAKIISGITPVVDFFADNDMAKWGLVATAGFVALASVITMVFGVFANFAGSMVKAGMALKSFFRFATGQRSLSYVATDELNASAAANSLATASERAATGLYAQANAAKLLTSQLEALIAAQTGAAGTATATGRGGGVVPRTNAPVPAAPRVTEAQMISMLKTSGNTVRAHVGQPMILSKAAEDALRATYLDANGNPLASKKQRGIDVQAGLKNGTIRGYSAMTLGWGSKTNAALSLGNKAGVPTQHLLDQLRLRPEEVMAPLLDDLARNSNMTTAQLIADPDVQKWAKDTTQKMSSGIATAGINAWHDPDVAKVVDPILQSMGKDLPKYRLAIERMLLPEQILTHPGAKRFEVSKEVASKAPEEFAAPRPKEASTAKALEAVAPLAGKLGSLPQVQVDSNGKSVAVVHPKGSATPQTAEALKPKTIKPAMPMKIAYSEQASRAISDRGPTTPAGRQFSGMGLMGAGMLASTAFMGLEMAGKQVPAAAEFAANGLMGIGMTVIESAQMFPEAMGKLSGGLGAVTAALGPWGIAIGATAAVVAGSALIWRGLNQKWRKQGFQLGQATTDATESLSEVGSIFGKVGIVQEQAAKDQKTTVESMTTGQKFLESDVGKQWLDDYAKTAGEAGVATATGSMASKLATAVVNGVMGTEDVRGVFAALTKQNAVMASGVKTDFLKLIGGSMKNIDPFAASLSINKQNEMQSRALMAASQQKINAATPDPDPGPGIWDSSGESRRFRPVNIENSVAKGVEMRSLLQQNAGLAAGAWSGTIATAFQNRLAAEVQLQQMIDARDDLASKKNRTGTETKQMNNLSRQIDNGAVALGKMDNQVHKTMDGVEELFNSSDEPQKGAMQKSMWESLGQNDNAMVKMAGKVLEGSTIPDARLKFTMSVALESGALQPEAMMNLFNQFGSPEAGAEKLDVGIDTIGTAPAMDFFNALATFKDGKQRAAMQSFGTEFGNIANKAKLSANEAIRLAAALKGSELTKGQTKSIRIAFKGPKEDPTKNFKDKNIKVNAKGDFSKAKKDVNDLGREVDRVGKKRASVRARVEGATKGINDLKNLGKSADGANRKKVKVDVDVSAAEQKAAQVEKALSQGNPPPVVISAQDNATAIAVAVQAQIMAMQAAAAVPSVLSAIDAASPVIGAVTASLNALNGKTVHTYVVTHHQDTKAIGGLFRYATGGVHSGHGKVTGPGGPTEDKVNARLSDGEFVIRASSVKKYGTGFMDAINRGMYEKNGFKAGTPIKKAPFAPKDKDGDSRAVEFGNEWRAAMYEAQNFMREFNNMGKIIKHGRDVLGKGFKTLDVEFAQYISDNFSPRQIKKLFSKNDKGARTIKKQFQAEQKMEARDQNRSASLDVTAAQVSGSQVGRYGGMAAAYQNISAEDIKLGMSQPKMLNKIMKKRAAAEKANQVADFQRQVVGTDANIVAQLGGDSGLAKAAEQLGMSMTEIANAMANGYTAQQIKDLGTSAQAAAEALETSLMSALDKASERSDNFSQAASLESQRGEAQARIDISQVSSWNPSGLGQSQLQAKMAVAQAQADIKQGEVDDINKKYEKQLNIVDQISQYQQAIANLERGRLTVAGALSQGDIAAAAAAAQQQRTDTASFMQGQMRTQLENQQKAATVGLQKEIDDLLKASRDTQNQMNLALAKAQEIVAPMVDHYQAESDKISVQNGLIDDQIKKLMDRNALLASPTAAPTPATSETTTPAGGSPQGGVPEATADSNLEWQIVNSNISRLNDKDMKFLEKNTFGGTPRGGGAWKTKFVSWSADKRNKLMSAVSNGIISAAEEKTLKFAKGGRVPGFGNSDSIHSMLTPGEFVVNRAQATKFGPVLSAINSGSIKSPETVGGNVNIDNIIFQINGTNLNERDIADIAVRKMKGLDSATIRGGRF